MLIIPIYLVLMTNWLMIKSSTMDPGIIPRRIIRMHKRYADYDIFYRLRHLSDNYRMKFWPTCYIFRPPRVSHCNTCNNWVVRWDHHWPWMGTCIGRRNFKYFYWFLVHLFFLTLYGFVMTIIHMFLVASEEDSDSSYSMAWSEVLRDNPLSLILWICIAPGLIFATVLVIYHTYLCWIDETTNENVKEYFKDVPFSPYSSESLFHNFIRRVFETTPKSLLTPDLRVRDKVSIHETKMALESK